MPQQEPIKKILDRERIHIHLKNKMISKWYWFALLVFLSAATYALLYAASCWLFVRWIIVVHIVFGVIGVAVCAALVKSLLPILTLARMVKGDRYLLVEDEIDYLEENGIKGMHLVYHGLAKLSKWRWEPILEHAIVFKKQGRLLVERYQLKGHSGGDKVYLVLPADKPDRVVLYYNADQYELNL